MSQAAEEWVRKYSRANASARPLMFALAHFAKGCVTIATALDLEREARISRPQLYRCLAALEGLGEIERMTQRGENKKFRTYHLREFCMSPCLTQKCSVSYRKQGHVSDIKRPCLHVSSLLPFPREIASPEDCEECRGSGYKDFTILTHDGHLQRVAIPCAHEIVAIAGGRWKPVETWQDQFLRPVLPGQTSERGAEQLTLAEFQERLRREELRRQQEKILQDHPAAETQSPEPGLPANVIVMRRKTA